MSPVLTGVGGERGISAGVGETPAGAFAWEWDLCYLHIDKPFKELKRTNTQDLSLSLMESWDEVWHDRSTVPLPALICHQQLCSF